MDVLVCLYCGLSIDDSEPYCSLQCRLNDNPSSSMDLCDEEPSLGELSDDDDVDVDVESKVASHSDWIGRGSDGIADWAASVTPGLPASPTATNKPSSRRSFREPRLLRRGSVSPSLCMSTPQTSVMSPSVPILTPQQQIASLSRTNAENSLSSGYNSYATSKSLALSPSTSAATDDADYARTPIFGSLASSMHSWVSSAPKLRRKASSPTNQPSSPNAKTFTVLAKAYGPQLTNLFEDDNILIDTRQYTTPPLLEKTSTTSRCRHPSNNLDTRQASVPNHPAFRWRGRGNASLVL